MEELEKINERVVDKRANGSQVFTEPYSQPGIGRLKHLVLTFYGQGERKFYSILVDGETVVPKNCDGRKFNNYLRFVNKHTKTVEVRMFQGYSPNCNKYLFVMTNGLSGNAQSVDLQAEIDKALEEQRIQNELQRLRINVEKKDKKIKKLKKLLENSGINMADVNTLVQEGKGILGALGFGVNQGVSGLPPEPEAEVEIEIEEESTLSEEQEIYQQLVNNVGKKGIKKALRVMTLLSTHPELESKLVEIIKTKQSEHGEA